MSVRSRDYKLVWLREFISRGLTRILADLKIQRKFGSMNSRNTLTDSFQIRECPR
jgi:hypothetical protein